MVVMAAGMASSAADPCAALHTGRLTASNVQPPSDAVRTNLLQTLMVRATQIVAIVHSQQHSDLLVSQDPRVHAAAKGWLGPWQCGLLAGSNLAADRLLAANQCFLFHRTRGEGKKT